ncbi:hypothetical protein GCM10020219_008690 [Nonomuraea dietziae]
MTTPAERYAAFRDKHGDDGAALRSFRGHYEFELDDFQLDACRALEAGDGVLVAAPTGSGKTVVGEFAVHLALEQGQKCFYTTPIKALSNQKYNDLVKRYGTAKVGLLTGDNSVNGDAPVVVMTTEVLRNMLYAGSATLAGLGFVVMDEVHYLADRFRGAVWEEVIIHLPESVRLAALSATVSNAEEFGQWLGEVRGDTTVIVDEHRPVPLWQHMMVGNRVYDLFSTEEGDNLSRINPTLLRLTRDEERLAGGRGRRGYGRPQRFRTPDRAVIIDKLDSEGLLPAITFIFSRAGCDAAVMQCLFAGIRLTTERESHEIRQIVDERTAHLPDEDLTVLGFLEWRDCLERGLAAHHAGMLPALQGGRGGAVHPQPGQGRLRHRDPRAGHQHARAQRGHRKARQVERRDPRRPHPGRVHPAHRAGRAARHRRRGPRGRRLAARHGPHLGGGSGGHPHLPAALQLPALLQHGRQPGRPVRPRARQNPPRGLLRAVPGRQGGGRHRQAAAQARGGARGLPRGDALPSRRLPRVRGAAPPPVRPRDRAGQAARERAQGRGGALARGAEAGRRHPRARRTAGGAWRSCSTPVSTREVTGPTRSC